MVLFVHLSLDVQVENTFHACRFHGGGHPCQQTVRFDIGEILVYQTVGCHYGFIGDNCAFGKSGAVADPDVLAEDDGLGQGPDFPVLVEILHVMERRVHELAVPCRAHVASDDNPVKAENLKVGAEIGFPFAELQRRIVGNHHVGAVTEDDRSVEDERSPHVPDALLDGGIDIMVVFPDSDHPGGDGSIDDDFPRKTAESHLPVEPHRQFLRHREGEHLEVEPEGLNHVDGSDDI